MNIDFILPGSIYLKDSGKYNILQEHPEYWIGKKCPAHKGVKYINPDEEALIHKLAGKIFKIYKNDGRKEQI